MCYFNVTKIGVRLDEKKVRDMALTEYYINENVG